MSTRNVINVEEVEAFVDSFAASARPEIGRWLRATVRGWILKHAPDASSLFIDPWKAAIVYEVGDEADGSLATVPVTVPGAGVPKWCIDAFARFEWIYYIHLNATLAKRVGRVVAWLEAALAGGGKAPRLDRLAFDDAEEKARDWRARESKRRRREVLARGEIPVFHGPGGAVIVRLTMTDSLVEEGQRLANCLAAYDVDLREGGIELYVLRDRHGKTRAAIEVGSGGRVWQVKGPSNGPVKPEHRQLIRHFIHARGFRVEGDFENIALLDPDGVGFSDINDYIFSATGERLLAEARYADDTPIAWVDTQALLSLIVAHADALSPAARRAVFDALRPASGEELRVTQTGRLEIYGLEFTLMEVSVCASLFALAGSRIFGTTAEAGEARAIKDITESRLAALAFADRRTLFDLGPKVWSYASCPLGPQSAADVLADSAIDVTAQRTRRQVAIREVLNRRKAETVGRRAPPSPGHLKVRRFFDGENGRDFL